MGAGGDGGGGAGVEIVFAAGGDGAEAGHGSEQSARAVDKAQDPVISAVAVD